MIIDVDRYGSFSLDAEFAERHRHAPVRWGYGMLSRVTFERTYSRDGETWWQTCQRVVEGMMTVQRVHCLERRLPWDERKAQHIAQEAASRLFQFKWTPPGRGLWAMGTRFVYECGGAALNNCGFVSTADLERDYAAPFVWMFQMAMLGVGVGFDTAGAGRVRLEDPARGQDTHVVEDSREGWEAALRRLLLAFTGDAALPARWDYSRIRKRGSPLHRFGGTASGPEPLQHMLEDIEQLCTQYVHRPVDSRAIVDTMNLVGRCVVAGGSRRSAQIALGEAGDAEFLDLKLDRDKLLAYRWASNNSVIARVGMDYSQVAGRMAVNGEPGCFWLDNARTYGRMKDPPSEVDMRAAGSNPCMEQTLWDRELCCLVETYPAHHDNLEDFQRTLRLAYLYAKSVTLVPTHDARTNAVMLKNRRIGCSMSGIVQAMTRHGYRRFLRWCDRAYAYVQALDKEYADWLCVPRSIKTTSIKPSGTVSLLAGATPGVHWEHAPYYIRRLRLNESHPLAGMCRSAGYPVETDVYSAATVVVSFPIHVPGLDRGKEAVSVREKVDLAARLQHYWSDNQVSCTADFDPATERDEVGRILEAYEDRLKGIVFLPRSGHGYEQPPYEAISRHDYERLVAGIKPLQGRLEHESELEEAFCEGGVCGLP